MKIFDKYFQPYAEYCLRTTLSEEELKETLAKECPATSDVLSWKAVKAVFGLSSEQTCISCMIDRNGNMFSKIAGSGRITTNQLCGVVEGISITPGSTLVTDKASAYVKFAKSL